MHRIFFFRILFRSMKTFHFGWPITALQMFGIVPCVTEKIDFIKDDIHGQCSKKKDIYGRKLEISPLLCIWCLLLRIAYIIGCSLVIKQGFGNTQNTEQFVNFSKAVIFVTFPYSALTAPLKCKANILLLNRFQRWKNSEINQSSSDQYSAKTLRLVIVAMMTMTGFIYFLSGLDQTNRLLMVESYIIMFAYTYFFVMIVMQVLLFHFCCSAMVGIVPDIAPRCTKIEINVYPSTIKRVNHHTFSNCML